MCFHLKTTNLNIYNIPDCSGGGVFRGTVSAVSVRCVVYLAIKRGRMGFRVAKVGKFCGKSLIVHTFP